MNCDQLREHYDLYALDIAEEPERSEIRAHLSQGCKVCMAGVKRSLETVACIGCNAPPAQPSPQLRRRILASVGSEQRQPNWMAAWSVGFAMAGVLAIAVYFGIASSRNAQEVIRLRAQIRGQIAQTATLTEAFTILVGPQTIEASFGGTQPRPPHGKVFVNPARGVLLIASNLPRTRADKAYEMWIIPKGSKPVPAGLFQSQEDGNAVHVRSGTVDVTSTAAVAVTVENEIGADQPTTTPLIVASIAGPIR